MHQRTMRFIGGSPAKALDVETVCGQACGLGGAADVVGPRLGAAYVDVALGEVGHPVEEGGQVVGGAGAGGEPRARRPPGPGGGSGPTTPAPAGARAAAPVRGRARRRAPGARERTAGTR